MHRRGSLVYALVLAGCGGSVAPPDASRTDVAAAPDAIGTLGAPTCVGATAVTDGTALDRESLRSAQERDAGCLGRVRSVAYRITVPAGETLTARVPAAAGPVVLQVVDDCTATRCLAQSSTAGVAPLRAVWRNDGSAPREVRVLAGSFSEWEGDFSIDFSLENSPNNLRCEDAEALGDGDWRGEQPFAPSATAGALCSDREAPAAAGLRWYQVTVPPGSVALATLTPGPALPGREYGLVAVMRDACDTDRCVAATRALVRARTTLVGSNDGAAPKVIRVGVGVYPPLADGRFSLAVQVRPRPSGTRCDEATELPADTDVDGTTELSPTTLPSCANGASGGPVRFHTVTVPPGRFLELRATQRDDRQLAVRAMASCADARCLASAQTQEPSSVLRLPNLGADPLRAVVAVGARDDDARASYRLRAEYVAPDAAGRCEGAVPLGGSRSMSGDTWRVAEPGPSCDLDATGPARWYRVTLAPSTAMRLTVGSVSDGGRAYPAAIRVMEACGARACLAAGLAQVIWSNLEDTPRDYLVAVGAQEADARGAFALYQSSQAVARNSRCDRATEVGDGAVVRNEQASQALASGPWCDPGASRIVRYYAATVPPGRVLHAYAVNPFGTYSYGMPELALREGCDAAMCLARSGIQGARGAHVWWRNASTEPRAVRVVAGWPSASGNQYNLGVETLDPSSNGRCADAEALALPLSRVVDLSRGDVVATPCGTDPRSPVSWFRATVAPGRALRVSATVGASSPTPRVVVDLLDGCEATTCLATGSAVPTSTVTWRNAGSAPREVRIALRAGDNAPIASVGLTVSEE